MKINAKGLNCYCVVMPVISGTQCSIASTSAYVVMPFIILMDSNITYIRSMYYQIGR